MPPPRFAPASLAILADLDILVIPGKEECEALDLPEGLTLEKGNRGYVYIRLGGDYVACICWYGNDPEGAWEAVRLGPSFVPPPIRDA